MNKEAGIINKGFAAMDLVDGAKKTKNTFQGSVNNKFDSKLGTSVNSKNLTNNGGSNAQISGMNKASTRIDDLYKQASLGTKIQNIKRVVSDADIKNSQYIKNMVDGIKNKQINKVFSNGAQAAKITIPAGLGMIGAGVGTAKGLKKIDEKVTKKEVQPDRALEYNTIGAGITAGLALGALAQKRIVKPYYTAGKAANNALIKMPMKAVRNSKAGKIVADTLKNSANAMSSANNALLKRNKEQEQFVEGVGRDLYNLMSNSKKPMSSGVASGELIKRRRERFITSQIAKGVSEQDATNAWKQEFDKLKPAIIQAKKNLRVGGKQASEYLDILEKVAGSKADYFKTVFKDHFIKEGLKSIPYYAAPAALSMALSTDLRHGMKKIDKEESKNPQLNESVQKTAAFKTPKFNTPFAKEMFEKGVDGVARTVFPATVMTMTGRNITNAFEKIDTENTNRNMQEDMANKIIIQINGNDNKRKIKRDVSKQLDSALSKQAAETPEKEILKNIKRDIEESTGKNKSVNVGKPKIGLGVKKQFRMKE